MTGKTHGAWGMVGGAGIAYLTMKCLPAVDTGTGPVLQLVGILIGGLAALLPDLDAEESLIQSLPAQEGRRSGFFLFALAGAILSGLLRLLSAIVRLFTKHREATHRVWAMLLVSIVSGILAWLVAAVIPLVRTHQALTVHAIWSVASSRNVLIQVVYVVVVVAIGWGSHLFLDALTPEGVRPFQPLWSGRVRLLRIKTSSAGDAALGVLGNTLVGLILVLYCISLLQQQEWFPWDLLQW